MGFDLNGIEATNKKSIRFRNNVWWWRPLWDYVNEVCKDFLTDKDYDQGCFNNGYTISKQKAEKIYKRLYAEIANQNTQIYSRKYNKDLKELTVKNKDKKLGDPRYEWGEAYPFSTQNVREFSEFCKKSGGFTIC